jgi:hypothetical protein
MGDGRAPDPNGGAPWGGPNPPGGPVPQWYGPAAHPGDVPAGFGPAYPPGSSGQSDIRPRVLWIVLAWVLFVVLAVVGVVGLVSAFFTLVTDAAPRQTFVAGEQIELFIDPADPPVIYASADQQASGDCYIRGDDPSAALSLTPPSIDQWVTVNGTTWYAVLLIGVPAPGRYQVLCEGDGLFGIGKQISAGWLIASVVLPVAGFLIAVVTTIVVLVRRNTALKRRLGGYPA